MQLFASIRIGDDEYTAWVLSVNRTDEGNSLPAVVEYRNFPFNSFAAWNGSYFGASEHGIFELTGDDDDGEPIDAWVRTAISNLGTG